MNIPSKDDIKKLEDRIKKWNPAKTPGKGQTGAEGCEKSCFQD